MEIATGRQKDTIAIARSEHYSVHAVLSYPCMRRVVDKFLPFFLGRNTPAYAPVGRSHIVFRHQSGQVVGKTIVPVFRLATVFGQFVIINSQLVVLFARSIQLRSGETVAKFAEESKALST